jgi:hypothetical protein
MVTTPSLMEPLHVVDLELVVSLKKIMEVSQTSGLSNGGVDVLSTSVTFDESSFWGCFFISVNTYSQKPL